MEAVVAQVKVETQRRLSEAAEAVDSGQTAAAYSSAAETNNRRRRCENNFLNLIYADSSQTRVGHQLFQLGHHIDVVVCEQIHRRLTDASEPNV